MTRRRLAVGPAGTPEATGATRADRRPAVTDAVMAAVGVAVLAVAVAMSVAAAGASAAAGAGDAGAAPAVAASAVGAPDATPASHLQFVDDFSATCTARNGVRRLIRNTHPTRTLRVWLERWHMGQGTGDRSRSDLEPGGEPQPLGCSRSVDGPQEWRLVRAVFVD